MVLEAILDQLYPGNHRYFPLQPTATFGEMGTGWKGVRRWCRELWQRGSTVSHLLSSATGAALDLLVIHVDADVAAEIDLQAGATAVVSDVLQPCPPVAATIIRLQQVIVNWLHLEALPPQVILAIPAQDTENWTFAALFPDDPLCATVNYECMRQGREHPGYRLTLEKYGKLLRRTEGRIRKSQRDYARVIPQIAANWSRVCRVCSQAEQFNLDLQRYWQKKED